MSDNEEFTSLADELKSQLSELSDKLDELSDEIEDKIESAVEDAVSDTVESAVECAMDSFGFEEESKMYILSQDKKILTTCARIQVYRIKKGEESYSINALTGNSSFRIGKYDNKDAALREMTNIAYALRDGQNFYELK